MSSYSEQLKALLAKEEESKTKKSENLKYSKEEIKTKYFTPIVPKGEKAAKFKIRLLPPPEGEINPFKKVQHHFMEVNGKWTNLLCLKETGGECPLCETHEALKAAGGDSKEINRFRPSTWYIVRVIDRNKETEGVKYWRFKDSYQKTGEFDKIKALIDDDYDLLDVDKGYDLTIDCGLNEKGKSVIKSIMGAKKETALSDDPELVTLWTIDDSTWKDVFKAKEFSYLEDVVYGRAAYWDAAQKKYVRPVGATPQQEASNVETKTLTEDDDDDDDDSEDKESIDLIGDDSDELPF